MQFIPPWKNHQLTIDGVVELVPTSWLYEIRGTDVTPEADLMNGTIVDMDTLWENIRLEGLCEPVIIRVGFENKMFRLESGNHRVQVLKKHNIDFIPATVQVQNLCGPEVSNVMTNATHNFEFTDNIISSNLKIGFVKPSAVFKDLAEKIV